MRSENDWLQVTAEHDQNRAELRDWFVTASIKCPDEMASLFDFLGRRGDVATLSPGDRTIIAILAASMLNELAVSHRAEIDARRDGS